MNYKLLVAFVAAGLWFPTAPHAQDNPYRVVEGWPQLPAAIKFGGVISVDPDAKGNIWVFHRNQPPILSFDASGKLLTSFGADMFVTDGPVANSNGRVMKLSKDGQFIKTWGKKGTAPGELDQPHSIAMDSRGRLFVADRSNSRVQICDQDGRFIDQWKQFGRPSGIYIDRNDNVVVADSQSNSKQNPGYTRGIRIGSARDGKVTALIPFVEPDPEKNNNAGVEGVAIDAKGNVYGAEVSTEMLKKYVKASATTTTR